VIVIVSYRQLTATTIPVASSFSTAVAAHADDELAEEKRAMRAAE